MARNLTRIDPLRDIARFDPFRGIDDIFREMRMMPSWANRETEALIPIDMQENDQTYTIKAEIPGVKKEDIKIDVNGNQISITAEVRREEDQKSGNMVRSERFYGQQYRSFSLPQDVDDEKAEAKYQDGILQLTLPKKAAGSKKQIDIH